MFISIVLLVVGLLLIIKGGDFFVAAAVRIAEFLKMPRVVIGTTLVSLTTTTPELVVSIMASRRGESGLAVGNAVGSCICNIGLILGLTFFIKRVELHRRVLRAPLIFMLIAGAGVFCMTFDLTVSRWQGGILLAAGVTYFIWDFTRHWRERKSFAVAEAIAIESEVSGDSWPWFQTRLGTIVQFIGGTILVIVGSKCLVDGAVGLASRMGVPSIFIGLTVVALGTSLPELVTAITSSRKAVSDLAVGNVLGANIANLTLIIGTAAVIQEVTMERLTQLFNFPALLGLMLLLFWMLLKAKRLSRPEGIGLLLFYAVYIAVLVCLALAGRATDAAAG
jgi:cation:H+ antiporter